MPNLPTRPYALVARGDTNPSICFRCGNDSMLIDMGAQPIGGYGVLYLCTNCFGELCETAGVIDRRIYDNAVAQFNTQLTSLQDALRNKRADDTLDAVARASNDGPWASDTEELHGLISRFAGLLDRLDPDARAVSGGSAVAAPTSEPFDRGAASAAFSADIGSRRPGGLPTVDGDEPVRPAAAGDGAQPAAEPAGDGGLLEGFDERDLSDDVEPIGNPG